MSFDELCANSDFASFVITDIIIGRKTFKTGRGFLPVMSRSQKSKIRTSLGRLCSGMQKVDDVWRDIKAINAISNFLISHTTDEIIKMEQHISRYLKIHRPGTTFTVAKCDRYPDDDDEGVKITAKTDIPKGSQIRGLQMCLAVHTRQQYRTMTETEKKLPV